MMGLFDLSPDEINLADIEERRGGFHLVPEGTYGATLTDVKDNYKEETGARGLIFEYTITEDPEHDGAEIGETVGEYKAYTLPSDPGFDRADFEKKMGYIKARLVDLGVPPTYQGIPKPDDLKGTEVVVKIVHNKDRKDPSKIYANIQTVSVATGATNAPAAPATSAASPSGVGGGDNPFA